MLVLTRKYQEKIRIGDNITITVLRAKGKAVRLGIEAPSNVRVIRGELTFDAAEGAVAEAATATAEPTSTKRATARQDGAPAWAAESPHQNARSRELHHPHVELKRMPRGDVAEYLPKLVDGGGPLRALMGPR